ncbi:MAG: flagellar basal body-associated FliL family protein [Gammaproteobacteria bacterium]|nr:flagellar basal body-associated FliL family protein [Gammaproteobacteria bacterium]
MADEQANETENTIPAEGGGAKKIILAMVALVLIAAGVAVGVMFFGNDEAVDEAAVAAETEPKKGPALYTSLHPPLVVNFKDSFGDSHFMQITMEVMARDLNVSNAVRDHTPVIRNALILLYSSANYDEVATREGKEKMLADGLEVIQGIMTDEIGEPGVEALYFTALVIQ